MQSGDLVVPRDREIHLRSPSEAPDMSRAIKREYRKPLLLVSEDKKRLARLVGCEQLLELCRRERMPRERIDVLIDSNRGEC